MELKKILICTDYDGTLSYGGVSKENAEAVKRFMAAGGLFTLSTGRRGEEMLDGKVLPFTPNAPMVGLTGSQIYDVENKCELYAKFLSENWRELMKRLLSEFPAMKFFQIVCPEGFTDVDLPNEEAALEAIKNATRVYKIVVIHENENDPIPEYIKKLCKEYSKEVTSNGHTSFEITENGVTKGSAVKILKEHCNAEKLVCIGDYFGDISSVTAADVGIAVANAVDELKAAADFVTVHAKDHAIARIIEKIMEDKL